MFIVKISQDMLGVVVHMWNLSTWEVDARGSVKANFIYIVSLEPAWATGDSVRKSLQQNTSQAQATNPMSN